MGEQGVGISERVFGCHEEEGDNVVHGAEQNRTQGC